MTQGVSRYFGTSGTDKENTEKENENRVTDEEGAERPPSSRSIHPQ